MSAASGQEPDASQQDADTPRALTLTNLMLAICFFMPISGLIATGRATHASFWFYCATLLPSLILGFLCAWIMWQSLNQVFLFISERSPELMQGIGFRGMCMTGFLIASMLVWCIITAALRDWMNSVIRHWIA